MNLGVNADNQSKFGRAGICSVLVKILRIYEENRDVIYHKCTSKSSYNCRKLS